jgi:hypothetical protein
MVVHFLFLNGQKVTYYYLFRLGDQKITIQDFEIQKSYFQVDFTWIFLKKKHYKNSINHSKTKNHINKKKI